MDDGRGNLVPVTPEVANAFALLAADGTPKAKGVPSVFSVGEELEIKNSRFKVAAIGRQFMRLQLLPKLRERTAELDARDAQGESV